MLSQFELPLTVHHHAHYRVWQRGGYDMNIWSDKKRLQKLDYNDTLQQILRLGPIPLCDDRIVQHLEKSKHDLSDGQYSDCLTNLRLTLKYSLEAVARKLAESRAEQLPSEKENEVRDYLKRINFLSEEEWRGVWGIYGLLSAGPHGHVDRQLALLGYAACVAASQYVIDKLQRQDLSRQHGSPR